VKLCHCSSFDLCYHGNRYLIIQYTVPFYPWHRWLYPYTPRSHRATTCRSSHDLKKYWIGTDRRLNRAIWQIMVFITTVLRCSHVQRAANTLLPRCYEDICRPAAAFTAFILRCRYDLRCFTDLEDHTTTSLRWCRSYHVYSPLLLRFMQWSTFILGFKHCFSLLHKLQTWCESDSSRFTSAWKNVG
jgi:hypothetical protein